jgi:hypothetical protein
MRPSPPAGEELLKYRTDDGSDTNFGSNIDSPVDEDGFKTNEKMGGFKYVADITVPRHCLSILLLGIRASSKNESDCATVAVGQAESLCTAYVPLLFPSLFSTTQVQAGVLLGVRL